jgi:hypothetical protein
MQATKQAQPLTAFSDLNHPFIGQVIATTTAAAAELMGGKFAELKGYSNANIKTEPAQNTTVRDGMFVDSYHLAIYQGERRVEQTILAVAH